MRALIALCLVLASCAPKGIENPSNSTGGDLKPGVRSRLVPGTTLGNAALQRDTITKVKELVASFKEYSDCAHAQMTVVDTWLFGEPIQSVHSDAFNIWEEQWTLDACGERVDLELAYMLHKSGVVYLSIKQ